MLDASISVLILRKNPINTEISSIYEDDPRNHFIPIIPCGGYEWSVRLRSGLWDGIKSPRQPAEIQCHTIPCCTLWAYCSKKFIVASMVSINDATKLWMAPTCSKNKHSHSVAKSIYLRTVQLLPINCSLGFPDLYLIYRDHKSLPQDDPPPRATACCTCADLLQLPMPACTTELRKPNNSPH